MVELVYEKDRFIALRVQRWNWLSSRNHTANKKKRENKHSSSDSDQRAYK